MMRPQEKTNLLKVGIFITFLFSLFTILTFILGQRSSIFDPKMIITTKVNNAQDLRDGAKVQLKGIHIGNVIEVTFENLDIINIKMKINKKYQKWIKEDSYIAVRTQGVLGDKFLEILGGSTDAPMIKNKGLIVAHQFGGVEGFIHKGEDILVVASKVLNKLDNALGDDRLVRVLENLASSSSSLDKLLSTTNRKSFAETFKNLSNISQTIKTGPGTLNSMIYDRTAYDDLRTILGGAQRSKMLKYFIRETIKQSEEVKK